MTRERIVDRADIWRSIAIGGDPHRADARLRPMGRRKGDAWMCGACDGDGVVLGRADTVVQPVKCRRCGGEGLEPQP